MFRNSELNVDTLKENLTNPENPKKWRFFFVVEKVSPSLFGDHGENPPIQQHGEASEPKFSRGQMYSIHPVVPMFRCGSRRSPSFVVPNFSQQPIGQLQKSTECHDSWWRIFLQVTVLVLISKNLPWGPIMAPFLSDLYTLDVSLKDKLLGGE